MQRPMPNIATLTGESMYPQTPIAYSEPAHLTDKTPPENATFRQGNGAYYYIQKQTKNPCSKPLYHNTLQTIFKKIAKIVIFLVIFYVSDVLYCVGTIKKWKTNKNIAKTLEKQAKQ